MPVSRRLGIAAKVSGRPDFAASEKEAPGFEAVIFNGQIPCAAPSILQAD
jgi:hypothetical protein